MSQSGFPYRLSSKQDHTSLRCKQSIDQPKEGKNQSNPLVASLLKDDLKCRYIVITNKKKKTFSSSRLLILYKKWLILTLLLKLL
jgi:hypothetical protein